jgi:hypothetical protein
LIKETGVPFLVVGIAGKVERILETNAQLSRLFAVRETLTPFRYDPADEASIQAFTRFTQYAQEAIAMPLAETLPRLELLYRLHYATEGVVGNLMNLLRYAALIARQQQRTTIALPILAVAFNKRLAKHLKGKVNPFETPGHEPFVAPPVGDARATVNQPGRRKRRGHSAASVLKAS